MATNIETLATHYGQRVITSSRQRKARGGGALRAAIPLPPKSSQKEKAPTW